MIETWFLPKYNNLYLRHPFKTIKPSFIDVSVLSYEVCLISSKKMKNCKLTLRDVLLRRASRNSYSLPHQKQIFISYDSTVIEPLTAISYRLLYFTFEGVELVYRPLCSNNIG